MLMASTTNAQTRFRDENLLLQLTASVLGARSGLIFTAIPTAELRMSDRIIPGIIPATKSFPMETSVIIP
jgi:hypothetical protein